MKCKNCGKDLKRYKIMNRWQYITCDCWKDEECTSQEGEKLKSFCNSASRMGISADEFTSLIGKGMKKLVDDSIEFTNNLAKYNSEENNMDDWKDLDKDASLDVIMNMGKYQIQLKSTIDGWGDTEIDDEVQLFEKINNRFLQYRYRLKPLEPIRITEATYRHLNGSREMIPVERDSNGKIILFDNRPVEIIK